MKTVVKKPVFISNLLPMIYGGIVCLTLSVLLDIALWGKAILFFLGSMTLFQTYRYKRIYERGWIYGVLPLIIPSVILTIIGFYFLVLSLLFIGKEGYLYPSLLMAIRIVAGLCVFGLVSLGISIFFGISEKNSD